MQMVFEPEEGAEIDTDDVIGDVRAAIAPICDRDFGFAQPMRINAVDVGSSRRAPIEAFVASGCSIVWITLSAI